MRSQSASADGGTERVHVGAPFLVFAQAVVDGVDEVPHVLQGLDQVRPGLLVERLEAAVGLLLELIDDRLDVGVPQAAGGVGQCRTVPAGRSRLDAGDVKDVLAGALAQRLAHQVDRREDHERSARDAAQGVDDHALVHMRLLAQPAYLPTGNCIWHAGGTLAFFGGGAFGGGGNVAGKTFGIPSSVTPSRLATTADLLALFTASGSGAAGSKARHINLRRSSRRGVLGDSVYTAIANSPCARPE